jgi:pimeloyl-ACP methyl ester carboxylesterase
LLNFCLSALVLLSGATSTDITLDTGAGMLAGTLTVPAGERPVPVALIIAGSGPTDRNGNSAMFPGGNNSLRQLADALAAAGVASLRYDKRGVGASASAAIREQDYRFDRMITDAHLWCDLLLADERFSSLTVIGHSQGSQVGMNAAWLSGADGFVSIAGPGRPILEVLREQLRTNLPVRTRVEAEKVLLELEQGRVVAEPPVELTIVLRPSVQPFLISWQNHDPVREIRRLRLPVLVLQGETDVQVSTLDAELLADARPGARLVVVPGMNHILKPVAGDNPFAHQASLVDSTLQVMPAAVAPIVATVRQADRMAKVQRRARERAVRLGMESPSLHGPELEDSLLASQVDLPLSLRVGQWARRFEEAEEVAYLFGLAEGGYVSEGSLVDDRRQDCVSLMYRVSELARARDRQDAVAWALRTRFAGAPLDAIVDDAGRVDYDHPDHLDFSLDMVRSGLWGVDVTARLTGATPDTVGSSRYAAGSFSVVPAAALVASELAEGDIVWLVLDPDDPKAAAMRRDHGLVIGHIGLVIVAEGRPWLVHAASSDLEGWYEGGTVVKVPLAEYLARVERYGAVMVTRF